MERCGDGAVRAAGRQPQYISASRATALLAEILIRWAPAQRVIKELGEDREAVPAQEIGSAASNEMGTYRGRCCSGGRAIVFVHIGRSFLRLRTPNSFGPARRD